MGKTQYIKSDGNGGFSIGTGTLKIITVLILILTSVLTVSAYIAGMKSDIEVMNTRFDNLLIQENKLSETHLSDMADCENNVNRLNSGYAVILTKLDNIEKSIIKIENKLEVI